MMFLHLYWVGNKDSDGFVRVYNIITMDNMTYRKFVTPFYRKFVIPYHGYMDINDIEVKHKDDLTHFEEYLKRIGYTLSVEEDTNI